jgi:hypothetical protein
VFQGGFQDTEPLIVGSQVADLQAYNDRLASYGALCDPYECPVALRWVAADDVSGTAWVKYRGGTVPGTLRLRAVLLEDDVIPVGPANDSPYHFVARDLAEVVLTLGAAGDVQEVPISLSPAGAAGGHLTVVVFVQSDDPAADHEILAVAGTR